MRWRRVLVVLLAVFEYRSLSRRFALDAAGGSGRLGRSWVRLLLLDAGQARR